jgi:hypothetical protein
MHSAGAVLLAAADAVANATMKLMGQVDIDVILSASSPSDELDIGSVVRT